jgi:hypothetical protein
MNQKLIQTTTSQEKLKLLATSYLPPVTLISLSESEHMNPTKRNDFYSAATMRMGPAATTSRFPQISFITFVQ